MPISSTWSASDFVINEQFSFNIMQMIPYDKQLDLKRDVVVKAYENYSGPSRFVHLLTR